MIEIRFVPAPGRDHVDQSWVNIVIERLNVNHWTPISRTTREHCAHMRYVHRLLQLDEEGEEIEDENLDELEDLFVSNDIPNFEAFLRKSIYSFTTRLSSSSNKLICAIEQSWIIKSVIWKTWEENVHLSQL